MEEGNFKNALVKGFFDLQNHFRWYLRRCGEPQRDLLKEFIEVQTLLLAPITPHICEEIWEKLGKKGFVSQAPWPRTEEKYIKPEVEKAEEIVREVLDDAREIMRLIKGEPRELVIVVAADWKYRFLEEALSEIERGAELREALRKAISSIEPQLRAQAGKIIGMIVKNPRPLQLLVKPEVEWRALSSAAEFYEKELGVSVKIAREGSHPLPRGKVPLPGRPSIIVLTQRGRE